MRRSAGLVVLFIVLACGTRDATRNTVAVLPTPGGGGTINGQVRLADGSAAPGVLVTLTGAGIPARSVVTDASGAFGFVSVPAGSYRLTAALTGFASSELNVEVKSGAATQVAAVLRHAAVAESITVTAEAPIAANRTSISIRPDEAPPSADRKRAAANTVLPATVVGGVMGAAAPVMPMTEPPLPLDRQYSKIVEHQFIDASKEATTTFAIDVDTASYANVRRYLNANQVPPADAVRIEEMINYFSYRYPQPSGREPFSLTADAAGCSWNPDHRLLRIGIQGKNLDRWRLAPNNLVFLIDVSGSMTPPQRLPLVKSAFQLLVSELRAEDTVAVVTYAGAEGLALPKTSGADKLTIHDAIARLDAGGSTAGGAGITLAYKIAEQNFIKGGNNRVILATDGDFNVGISNLDELQKLIEEKRKSGVFLTTIGVGEGNYRDQVLETLANKGNGNYHFLDTINEAKKVFTRDLTGNLVTIAKDVKVQLEFNPALVKSYRQVGYENRVLANQDFDDDSKDAGELGAGHSVTALYEIVPTRQGVRGELAKVRLRYKAPDGDKSELITSTAVDEGKSIYAAPPDFQFAAAVAQFGMLLRNSPHKGTATYADTLAM
ncbi:MAG TPA: von Willebrand factor type A domain-containing protein, partial [Thermoanaerobaculia bacterium]|nr:von Willebrand factor type A domain-containing protein [Thermoanaerobaculia bacterium]